jgi:hypothetical protein
MLATELVTNAVLHGAPPIVLRLRSAGMVVRIEVEDAGQAVPIRAFETKDSALTGRGLTVIDALATGWGVEPCLGLGKVVWVDIGGQSAEFLTDLSRDSGREAAPDEPTYDVVLGDVPTDLLLAAKAHIDNVVRELLLVSGHASSAEPLAPELAALIVAVTEDFAAARTEIKRQAIAAAERGDPLTQLRLSLRASAGGAGQRYLTALDEFDRYAKTNQMLTSAPPASHQAFRTWYVTAIIEQLRAACGPSASAPPG